MMWKGKVTEELIDLYKQYHELFPDGYPDEYEEIEYYAMTYNEFISFIKECIKKKKEMPYIVP